RADSGMSPMSGLNVSGVCWLRSLTMVRTPLVCLPLYCITSTNWRQQYKDLIAGFAFLGLR
ncbi:hypothetical protein, partial [Klebsiella michiganensis]|uniref:hypothetical protein n=1 Tax=Klebsiella michiganensis TaxID=1134687 RepID=UPI001C99362C